MANDEDRDDPAKDGLIRQAREAFFQTLLSGRTPIAFVGSGLSLIYGGVNWTEAVDIILDDALLTLRHATGRNPSAVRDSLLARLIVMAEAQRERGEKDDLSGADRYVALKLAEDAFRLAAADLPPAKREQAPSVASMFADLARDNSKAITQILARRVYGKKSTSKDRTDSYQDLNKILRDADIQAVRDYIYNFRRLREKPFNSLAILGNIADQLELSLPDYRDKPLPIDKPYIFAPILACLTQDQRIAVVNNAVVEVTSSPVPSRNIAPRPDLDPLHHLHNLFGFTRYITLNYDFELENLVMVPDLAAACAPKPNHRVYGFDSAISDGLLRREAPDFGVTRRLPDGRLARSDIYRPGSAARLFELGLNSPDHSFHIMHLHGRADDHHSMVTRDEDVNRLYRRSTSHIDSLEQALDLALTANPVLFLGTAWARPKSPAVSARWRARSTRTPMPWPSGSKLRQTTA